MSVDTWKPAVARAALDAGAVMINDTSGLEDLGLAEACAATGAALVVMHTRAAPKQERFADYGGDVVADVVAFLVERCAAARAAGVGDDQLVLDPGPDFAKTPEETVAVLRAIDRIAALGRPLLLAVSRKYFVGAITGRHPAGRLAGTLAAVGWAADAGAGDRPRPRRRRDGRLPAGQERPRRRRRGARVRHRRRGAEVDPGRRMTRGGPRRVDPAR